MRRCVHIFYDRTSGAVRRPARRQIAYRKRKANCAMPVELLTGLQHVIFVRRMVRSWRTSAAPTFWRTLRALLRTVRLKLSAISPDVLDTGQGWTNAGHVQGCPVGQDWTHPYRGVQLSSIRPSP